MDEDTRDAILEQEQNIYELKKIMQKIIPDLYRFHDVQKCKNVRTALVERILRLEELADDL